MADLRRAGRGRVADGTDVTWSVAEGRRGRRWREVRTREEGIVARLLLETDPDGRFAHLELSTAAGLLTLHPEGDGTLHGNAVTADGVEHVVGVPWPRRRAPPRRWLVDRHRRGRLVGQRPGEGTPANGERDRRDSTLASTSGDGRCRPTRSRVGDRRRRAAGPRGRDAVAARARGSTERDSAGLRGNPVDKPPEVAANFETRG